ncbi:MAG: hypothetical protein J5640_03030 [Bacteroidales bacterium]|nr:hypothetical protein [Bacteroidales bacterium]MBR5072407.1 hypothetical protein [Bacteroidales bacterium]
MKNTYHLCLSSHDEVMFRNEADLIIGFNYLAVAALETDSVLLADGFLSTHHHEAVRADSPYELARRNRYSYTRYFNAKYHRRGSLGEKECFLLNVEGLYHVQALLNYIFRQGLHHGMAVTPFGYKHCSANAIFREELGKSTPPALIDDSKRYLYLPCNKQHFPLKYRMSSEGLLLREDIEDTAYVESVYVSPRNFLFQMNRISDAKDIADQQKENSLPAVTLESVERGVPGFDPSKAFIAEQGRVNKNRMTDIELCHIIDDVILPSRYFKGATESSLYLLPERKRADLGNALWQEFRNVRYRHSDSPFSEKTITEDQLRRCLCIP